MKIKAKNFKWANKEHTLLDCKIRHNIYGWIPYTTSKDDNGVGKEIWDSIDTLQIEEYTDKVLTEEEIAEKEVVELEAQINDIKDRLMYAILLNDTETIDSLRAEYGELL